MIKRLALMVPLLMIINACNSILPQIPDPTATAAPVSLTATYTNTPSPSPIPPTSTQRPTDTPAPPTATSTPVAYGPDNFPTTVDPLTGLAVSNVALLERRPVSVKVQIFPRGQRPPWGISFADIVYDYYQNNGMTRFHAIFYGQDAKQVGPIRSGRLFDSQLVTMYKSILAFGGADRRILATFYNSDFADRLVLEGANNCPPMCRIDPNGANILVADTAEISSYANRKGISNQRQDLNGMSFNEAAPANGQPGQQIFVRFSISAYNRWDYDESSGRYLRFQDVQEDTSDGKNEVFEAMTDRLTGQQVATDNVIVLLLPHQIDRSKSGQNEIVNIQLSGDGGAYAFRNGQIFQVRWNRPTKDATLFLTFPDGTPYTFKPGNLWFEVIGESSMIENAGPGGWRFVFGVP
jgi:hypothetical protein